MKIISGSSNTSLSTQIAQALGTKLVDVELSQFSNGEKRVWIKEQLKGETVTIVQSCYNPVDEHVMELLLMIDAVERLGARNVNLVIPWMGYSLQDKVFRQGEPIAAKVVANLLSNSYTKRIFLLDLHNTSTPGFFSKPTTHLSATDLFVSYVKNNLDLNEAIVASPDFGGLKRARVFADILGLDLVNIDKHRDLKSGQVTAMGVHGEVEDKTVILFDDCILSGSTVKEAAQILKEQGAKQVIFLATHGLFVGDSLERLEASAVDKIVVTNSIEQPKTSNKLEVLDTSSLFAEVLETWS